MTYTCRLGILAAALLSTFALPPQSLEASSTAFVRDFSIFEVHEHTTRKGARLAVEVLKINNRKPEAAFSNFARVETGMVELKLRVGRYVQGSRFLQKAEVLVVSFWAEENVEYVPQIVVDGAHIKLQYTDSASQAAATDLIPTWIDVRDVVELPRRARKNESSQRTAWVAGSGR